MEELDCCGYTSSVPVASAYSQPRIHQILLHGHVVGKVWELFRQFVSFIFVFILFALFFIPRSYCYFFLGFSALRVLFSAARCLPVGFSSNECLAFCVSVHFFLSLTWSSHQRNFVFALCLLRVCGSRISYTCFLLVTGLSAQWTLEARWLMFTLLMTWSAIFISLPLPYTGRKYKTQTHTYTYVHTHTYTHGRFTFAHGLFMNSEHYCNDCNAPALTLFELLIWRHTHTPTLLISLCIMGRQSQGTLPASSLASRFALCARIKRGERDRGGCGWRSDVAFK